MQRIEEFVDERQKSWCIHCVRSLAGLKTNDDHVPSKSLLTKPRPHHLPVVTICRECNTSFSLDEQYTVTFISCVLAGSTDPERQLNASAARALADSSALRARIEQSRTEYRTIGGEMRLVWQPDIDRIQRVVVKNARGHAYFEYGEPMLDPPAHIRVLPLEAMSGSERQRFEGSHGEGSPAVWPEVGSRMMTRLATGEDLSGSWVTVQDGIYRYSVQTVGDGLQVRTVLYEYLAAEVQWEH
ncbi:hypothetical protein NFI95_16095 [Acetobacteraceae bacterium KSS8]|uniref:HNH endonuclease n=1 Tax=Endosaccharibacter trunci TaxID=2812733 RepID=A0ABT1WAQ5_9PROT|nr:hypothetical protein [Acetobacteraceae bacterium KSS8]